MEAKLVPILGFDGGEIGLPPTGEVVMGRGEEATVRLMQSKVSRAHCTIAFQNGFYQIWDHDSKNGTWINNKRIHKAILFHQDRVTVGSAEFRFVLQDYSSAEGPQITASTDDDVVFETEIREPVDIDEPSSYILEGVETRMDEDRPELERDLSAVCKIINSVNSEHQLDHLLNTIMDSAMEVTQADRGYLITARKLHGVLLPLVSRNRQGLPPYAQNSFSRSIVTECYQKHQSILMADPTDQQDPSESVVAQKIQGVICVPMYDNQGPVGVIYVDRILGSKPFAKRDLRILTAIGNQAGFAIRRAQLSQQVESLFRDAMRTVINLVEVKDQYTYGHSERVTAVTVRLAELCSFEEVDLRDVELAGLLHDVGKLAIRLDILQKPGRLTDSEYLTVKEHPSAGAVVLETVENGEDIAGAIRHHHEWWDGSGYPDGLAEEGIPLMARLLAIADAYDSMAAGRPYRDVMPRKEILAELEKCSGTQFDPYLADKFVQALAHNAEFQEQIDAIYRRKDATPVGKGPFN